ncbi:TPA: dATP/dGTP pyrophosphohydrolase domain-containing protein [Klebsiella pneumoniae]|nr:dATP/dGTP pyrophosphohydrolase domain-containing protein [Klebsiella pneumoniae]
MTKSTITRERLQELAEGQSGFNLRTATHEESQELARIALAAMDSEPVAWTWHYREQWHVTNDERRAEFVAKDGDVAVLPLYRHAQPAPERDQVRSEHAEWSTATFGNVGPVGPLKHLSKEALEAAAEPGDLSEWADMQFLLWDAQRRAGITDEQITQAMIEKLAVNKQRKWPEPKDGEPRLHIKEQPAPVVLVIPDEMTSGQAYEIGYYYGDPVDVFARGANWMRQHIIDSTLAAAQHDTPALNSVQSVVTVPGKWIPVSERMPIEFEAVIAFDGDQVYGEAMYSSDDGFTIDGYEPCDRLNLQNVTHWMPLPAAPQEVNHG